MTPPTVETTFTWGWGLSENTEIVNGFLGNRGTINVAEIFGFGSFGKGGATYDAMLDNLGTINFADVRSYGKLNNRQTATVEEVNIYNFGQLTNSDTAGIGTLYVEGDGMGQPGQTHTQDGTRDTTVIAPTKTRLSPVHH